MEKKNNKAPEKWVLDKIAAEEKKIAEKYESSFIKKAKKKSTFL